MPIQEKKCDAPGHYTAVVCTVAKTQSDPTPQIEKCNAGVTMVTCEELRKDTAALGGERPGTLKRANRSG